MTDGTESLVSEHLRVIRGDMARMWDAMRTMSAEVAAMRQQLSGVMTLRDHDHVDVAALKVRLDPGERRLELVD